MTHDGRVVVVAIYYEAKPKALLDADYELIDYARSVLYGTDGRAGLCALRGVVAADLLCCAYLGAAYCAGPRPDLSRGARLLSRPAAAREVGVPERTAYRLIDEALDLVDMWGFEVVISGMGEAS